MALYEYKCVECGTHVTSDKRESKLAGYCPVCPHDHGYCAVGTTRETCGKTNGKMTMYQRVWSVSIAPVMQEHWNTTVGRPISDMKKFRDHLRAAGNKATDETGIPHRYEPVDMNDMEAVGATGEGIYESNVERSKRGEPLLPLPPGA